MRTRTLGHSCARRLRANAMPLISGIEISMIATSGSLSRIIFNAGTARWCLGPPTQGRVRLQSDCPSQQGRWDDRRQEPRGFSPRSRRRPLEAGRGIREKIVVPVLGDDFNRQPAADELQPSGASRQDQDAVTMRLNCSNPCPSSSMAKCNVPSSSATPITRLTFVALLACFAILVRPS